MKRMKEETPATCDYCGVTFLKYRPEQKFCKPICRQRYFWKTLKEKAAKYDEAQRAKDDLFAA